MAVKVLRKVRNTYRLLQAVGQDLIEWRKGVWYRLLAALRPADLGNAIKKKFIYCHVFGRIFYTALNHAPVPPSPSPSSPPPFYPLPLSTGHHLVFCALSERRNGE